jgi:hypothetical protein
MAHSRDENIFNTALGAAMGHVRCLAAWKNIPVNPEECDRIARAAIEHLPPPEAHVRIRCKAAVRSVDAINRALDVLALSRVALLIARDQGEENPDLALLTARAEHVADLLVANDADGLTFRWPEPDEYLRQCYASHVSRPVGITLPRGASRASVTLGGFPEAVAEMMTEDAPAGEADAMTCQDSRSASGESTAGGDVP